MLLPYTAIHLALSAVLLWLGFILGYPSPTFALSPAYTYMERLAPEWAWAAVFLAAGTWGVRAAFSRSVGQRWWSAITLASLHAIFGIFLAIGSPMSTGSGTYCLIAALGYYLVSKLVTFDGDAAP